MGTVFQWLAHLATFCACWLIATLLTFLTVLLLSGSVPAATWYALIAGVTAGLVGATWAAARK
ncbi:MULTISPECIES: hypothetical protein [unclassified Chelatococcus]|uniref:hypothetical protein n=1 Tax=unclassified Chelatococcus TaxID=2638111 RepID=UPI001BCBE507|nr:MULTISPECIES: hypothetical protein [unclassified Chelatococcus]MBS7700516.1 hypothetical protein [Chelatococcus sp. YT9]MBX3556312.1 hypothetical protein [Chelatococcus sp.]